MQSISLDNVIYAVGTFLITWGAMRAKVIDLEKRTEALELRNDSHHEVYVNYKHFNEALGGVRENYRDLKDDVKKILILLSER